MTSLHLKLENSYLVLCFMLWNTFSLDGLEFIMMAKYLPGFSVHNFGKGSTKNIRDQILSINRKSFSTKQGTKYLAESQGSMTRLGGNTWGKSFKAKDDLSPVRKIKYPNVAGWLAIPRLVS